MAKINGIQIKNLKRFIGHEGYCYQGDIYLNGKKLGFWSQDGWGGPDNFDFNESALNDAVAKYKDGIPDTCSYKDFWTVDVLLGDLVELMEVEKDFKKHIKSNPDRNTLIHFVFDCYKALDFTVSTDPNKTAIEGVMATHSKWIEEKKKELGNSDVWIARLEDFDMQVDREHPIPSFLVTEI